MIYKCPICGDKREWRLPWFAEVGRLRCVKCGFESLVVNEDCCDGEMAEWEEVKL